MTGGGIVLILVCEVNHGAGANELLRVLDTVSFEVFDIFEGVLKA